MRSLWFVSIPLLLCLTIKNSVQGADSKIPFQEAQRLAVFAPRLEYPYNARKDRITGSGVVIVNVGVDGKVRSVSMRQSTGSPILDRAATSGFQRWRFTPGRAFYFWQPISFTLQGAYILPAASAQQPVSPRSRPESGHNPQQLDEADKPPVIGMTKAQVLARYGEPKKHTISDEGEKWVYLLNFGEVLGKAFIPFNFKPTAIRTGVIVFGPDGRVKKFDWDVPTDG